MASLGKGGNWRNWVGNQSFVARHRNVPESEAELCELVALATSQGMGVRVAGSGHSFTPVVAINGLQLSLEKLNGVVSVNQEAKRVTVKAGTRINQIGRELKALGLSLRNQGDIDSQAIVGAMTTGTHGTGLTLGNLASSAVGFRIVQPDGSVLAFNDTTDLDMVNAARVSIGMLGVISEVTISVMEAYNLKEKLWRDDFETAMAKHDELAAENRHFGFFWCPTPESRHLYCLPDLSAVSTTDKDYDCCEMKVMNITDEAPFENEATFERAAYSSEIYPITYVPNFHEFEYAVPVEAGVAALREIRALILSKHTNCIYPVEYRFIAGDDAMLSPFYKRPSVMISVSGGPGIDYWEFLTDCDTILRRYDARPHWGKLHFNEREDLPRLYPRYHDFCAIRDRLDPRGVFLNDHLRALFG
ncbi:D-arabinono-1,4-lactone oxidase [Oryzibacter oryziterrae]|uniref:D-arabinono-1,4-lactone oxidase n=1 Tax=Oryzibacter oryziterrae TaxID=2766474 RepID=UPI001F23A633|nr:D-arabinono-1,4-lactone oxidase [Oryzibacter oryziterrae]